MDDQPVVARALYDFTAEGGNELSFSVGDELVNIVLCVCVCVHLCTSVYIYFDKCVSRMELLVVV